MPARDEEYNGVRYEDMIFDDVDWSEVGEHDPARRAQRKGAPEENILTGWADEAVRDERRWVRSAGSRSGITVKVTGYSPTAGLIITVIVAPKDQPPRWRWWGATAWKAKKAERESYEGER
ncbi:hypothetical protein EF847_22055 [Actinobacteria bacterium YIM 96077]|uniref:BrnT family toxin n=1 Tax=Phytoactinopolyspora halophila TaxID=1981511 RepID=A0A329QSR1_9ACTN|nr:hypothetical protein [Phytoactinopolyspora halophila]AYY14973.1 hypothetical protein EF847_22055 [Actinobacteria bacterium YIM 96077]RAW15430.1 hypothetical protein DPM12_09285 [Phytoactinopolyspora halophila]